jgi:hypothetical protein
MPKSRRANDNTKPRPTIPTDRELRLARLKRRHGTSQAGLVRMLLNKLEVGGHPAFTRRVKK